MRLLALSFVLGFVFGYAIYVMVKTGFFRGLK